MFLLASTLLTSCGLFRKSVEAPEGFLSKDEAWTIISEPQNKVDWLSAKYKATLTTSSKINLTINLKMKRDSAIWLSLSPGFGIEVARVLIRPDSVWAVDKFNKRYLVGSQEQLAERFNVPVDFQVLQGLFLAEADERDFQFLEQFFTMEDFSMIGSSTEEVLLARLSNTKFEKDLIVAYGVKNGDPRIGQRYWLKELQELDVRYNSFEKVEGKEQDVFIPSYVSASFKEKASYNVKFELVGAEVDGPYPLTISIPGSYEAM